MWKSKAALAAVTMRWWNSRSLGQERKVKSKLITLEFSRANFGLFRDLLGRVL